MSVQAITAAFALPPILTIRDGEDGGVSVAAKFLLVTLANYADDVGRAWPRQETLARDTSLSLRGVRDGLDLLEARGLIRRDEARHRKDGTRRSDVIHLLFMQPATVAGSYGADAPDPLDVVSSGTDCRLNTRQRLPVHAATVAGYIEEPPLEPPVDTLSSARVIALAGDALASMATHPGIASLHHLTALTRGANPCSLDDIYAGVEAAAAWHRSKGGPGSMTSWTVAIRMAGENRDRTAAGAPGVTARTDTNGNHSRADASLEAASRALARRAAPLSGGEHVQGGVAGSLRLPGRG